jgi:hypothetical protein
MLLTGCMMGQVFTAGSFCSSGKENPDCSGERKQRKNDSQKRWYHPKGKESVKVSRQTSAASGKQQQQGLFFTVLSFLMGEKTGLLTNRKKIQQRGGLAAAGVKRE